MRTRLPALAATAALLALTVALAPAASAGCSEVAHVEEEPYADLAVLTCDGNPVCVSGHVAKRAESYCRG